MPYKAIVSLFLLSLGACAGLNNTGQGYPYGSYGSSQQYCNNYDRYGRCVDQSYWEQERDREERLRWERQRDREEAREAREDRQERRRRQLEHDRRNRERQRSIERKPVDNVIRPSCPSGTEFTGRTCRITDSRLKKPGGDGNINPCPKGMWLSGDRCVK